MAKADASRESGFSIWGPLSYLLLPYAVISLVWRALRYRPYAQNWVERFASVPIMVLYPTVS